MSDRRSFIIHFATIGTVLASAQALGQGAMVSEADAQAAALGYKADSTKVDKTKFPKYAAGQQCGNCVLFQGKPGDASAGCGIFPGKQVATKGWCSAWAKKA
jgi:hypothetical protein